MKASWRMKDATLLALLLAGMAFCPPVWVHAQDTDSKASLGGSAKKAQGGSLALRSQGGDIRAEETRRLIPDHTDVLVLVPGKKLDRRSLGWKPTLWVHNLDERQAKVQFFLLRFDQSNPAPALYNDTLAPGKARRYDNVMEIMFGETNGAVLRVVSDRELVVRTSFGCVPAEPPAQSTIEQSIAAVPSGFAIGAGEKTMLLRAHRPSSIQPSFNCEPLPVSLLGLVEIAGGAAIVRVTALDENGAVMERKEYTLAAYEPRLSDLRDALPDLSAAGAKIEVEVLSGSGRIVVFGSELDRAEVPNENLNGAERRTAVSDGDASLSELRKVGSPHKDSGAAQDSTQQGSVTGSGTQTLVPLWTGPNTLGSSQIVDDGQRVTIGGVNDPSARFQVTSDGGNAAISARGQSFVAIVGTSDRSTGVAGVSQSGPGIVGDSAAGPGVSGNSRSGRGVHGKSESLTGVLGESTSGVGVGGRSASANGVQGESTTGIGVIGQSNSAVGVQGQSSGGDGVFGKSEMAVGVKGQSGNNAGVAGFSQATGVQGESSGGGAGVLGKSMAGAGVSGSGNPGIKGESTAGAGVSGSGNPGIKGTSGSGVGVSGESQSADGVFGMSNAGRGMHGLSSNGAGVLGESMTGAGVIGQSNSAQGVLAISNTGQAMEGTSESGTGIRGTSASGIGVGGISTSNAGVQGDSTSGAGVVGISTSNAGVQGQSTSGEGVVGISTTNAGVVGISTSNDGVKGQSEMKPGVHGLSTNDAGVQGESTNKKGVVGRSTSFVGVSGESMQGWGVQGVSESDRGVIGFSKTSGGVQGESVSSTGVAGFSTDSFGLQGSSEHNRGVVGFGKDAAGVQGQSENSVGVVGISMKTRGVEGLGVTVGVTGFSEGQVGVGGLSKTGFGLFGGCEDTASCRAGQFNGHVSVAGLIFGGVKAFRIDHPLDPENQYLNHLSVESSEMKNMYDGVIVLDSQGEAVVRLPEWFEALNRDFRYQLTCIGGFAPVYVSEKIRGNRFKIAGGTPGLEVSWQVTGVRHDAFALAHPIPVEEAKPAADRGYYLYPKLYGRPSREGILWRGHEDLLEQLEKMSKSQPAASIQPQAKAAARAEAVR